MNLKLACADFSFPLLPHIDALRLIAMLGFKGVDIGIFGGRSHVRLEELNGNLSKMARELSNRVRDVGLEFADIYLISGADFRSLAPNHPDTNERQKARDQFERAVELTAKLNCPHISGLPGIHWESEDKEVSLKRCADELNWRLQKANEAGIVFSIEPHCGGCIVSSPAEVLMLLEKTPGLTLTLDYSHFVCQGICDDEIEPLLQHASHFHARGARPMHLQSSLQENLIDFPRIVNVISEIAYQGHVCVEYVWIDWHLCDKVDNLSETILMRDLLLKANA